MGEGGKVFKVRKVVISVDGNELMERLGLIREVCEASLKVGRACGPGPDVEVFLESALRACMRIAERSGGTSVRVREGGDGECPGG